MKLNIRKVSFRTLFGVVASLSVIISFQNCGKAGFDSTLDENLTGPGVDAALAAKYGTTVGAAVAGLPFAFDAGFDQITYNSCAEPTLIGSKGFFSIKAGAYQNGGVRLSDEFFQQVDRTFKPSYGETSINQLQYQSYLGDSPANKDAILNLAIRSPSDLEMVHALSTGSAQGDSSSIALDKDVKRVVGNLTDSSIMDAYTVKQSGYISYFPFSSESKIFEASLTFNESQEKAQAFRNKLDSTADIPGVLTLTYLKNITDLNSIRGPSSATPVRQAFGRRYNFSFSLPENTVASAARVLPKNIVREITEVDLDSGAQVAWNCNRKYLVVRYQDRNPLCPPLTWNQLQDPLVLAELDIARRQLRADEWDINPVAHCMVPKGTSCYNNDADKSGVNYWPGGDPTAAPGSPESIGECYNPLVSAGNYRNSQNPPTKRCANYISICTRF